MRLFSFYQSSKMPQNQNYLGSPQTDIRSWTGNVPVTVSTSTEDFATGTHAAAVVTIPAPPPGYSNVICGIICSYSAGTPAGSLKIEDGSGNIVFSVDLAGINVWEFDFNPPRAFSNGVATIITLADGSASVVGKLNIIGRYTDTLGSMLPYTSLGFDFSQLGNSQYIPVLAL